MTLTELGSHLLVFALGVGSGVAASYLSAGLNDARQERKSRRTAQRKFDAVRDQMTSLIAELRSDLLDNTKQREFLIAPNRNVMINTGGRRVLVFYRSEHPDLLENVRILENHGYVRDETSSNLRRYCMSEDFVSLVLERG